MISLKGVAFTESAIDVMRQFALTLRKDNLNALCWAAYQGQDDTLRVALCGDREPQPNAIPDQVDDLKFYWYAEPCSLEALRRVCVDAGWNSASRLLPLRLGTEEPID